jgi:hypothetical protein
MNERVHSLVQRFESANTALIASVEACSDADWQRVTSEEGWPVGVAAHHVARSYPAIGGFVVSIANGTPPIPLTPEMLDANNAQHAVEAATCTREETLDLLRQNGQAASDALRGLRDDQLRRTAPLVLMGGAEVSAEQMIELAMIGHPVEHLASIENAIGHKVA